MIFRNLALMAIALTGMLSAPVEGSAAVEQVRWGYLNQPIEHPNGVQAWNLRRQGEHFNLENAFYHQNGVVAWDGMSRAIDNFGRSGNQGIFYHDNGQIAWGGIKPTNEFSSSYRERYFYHPTGAIVWRGVRQQDDLFGDRGASAYVYHSNGAKAWGGKKQKRDLFGNLDRNAMLFYSNGQLCWDGEENSPIYDSLGNVVAYRADYVQLHLGDNTWLYLSVDGEYELSLGMGAGYRLRVSESEVVLDLYGTVIKP